MRHTHHDPSRVSPHAPDILRGVHRMAQVPGLYQHPLAPDRVDREPRRAGGGSGRAAERPRPLSGSGPDAHATPRASGIRFALVLLAGVAAWWFVWHAVDLLLYLIAPEDPTR